MATRRSSATTSAPILQGMVDRGNLRGIWIDGVPDNRIENNLISGRDYVASSIGVEISGIAARNNQVIRNRIGTDVTGNVAIGNNYGILISNAPRTASTKDTGVNNRIGGTAAGEGNTIAFSCSSGPLK